MVSRLFISPPCQGSPCRVLLSGTTGFSRLLLTLFQRLRGSVRTHRREQTLHASLFRSGAPSGSTCTAIITLCSFTIQTDRLTQQALPARSRYLLQDAGLCLAVPRATPKACTVATLTCTASLALRSHLPLHLLAGHRLASGDVNDRC